MDADEETANTESAGVENQKASSSAFANFGMGLGNGSIYYATPICNGQPLDITAMKEICLVPDVFNVSTGAQIELSALSMSMVLSLQLKNITTFSCV